MAKAPAVGIDLGTTFSAISLYEKGTCTIIPNKDGMYLTPSLVYYHPNSSEVSVGELAREMSLENIGNFIFDTKRIIGRRFDDAYVQELRKDEKYRYKILKGNDDKIEIEVQHNGILVRKTPEEISSEVLKYLKESASEHLGKEVTEAVISIPAYFSNAQRKATKKAAELAGLKLLKFITEPVAGAIHYCQKKLEQASKMLVFDFGGGTLDVSIIESNSKMFEVKAVEGDTFLGGRDIDKILVDHFKPAIIAKYGVNSYGQVLARRLEDLCLKLKIDLSKLQSRTLKLHCIAGLNDQIEFTMTRKEFEKSIQNLIDLAMNLVMKCLKESGISQSDLTDVVLVGGTTRIPIIREKLISLFGESKIRLSLNPDEAVALGAGIQAAFLQGGHRELEKYRISEMTPLSLGLDGSGDLMTTVIKKNSRLPVNSSVTRVTVLNNQTSVIFKIYEGERKNCLYNNFLGKFEISNLPPGRAGDTIFNVTFKLDEDGILEVEAHETSKALYNKLVLTLGEFRFSDHKIRQNIEDAQKNKEEDDAFEKFVNYKYKIEKNCNYILYDLHKIRSNEDREYVEKKCNGFMELMKMLKYSDIDQLEAAYKIFKNCVAGIVEHVIHINFEVKVENLLQSSLHSHFSKLSTEYKDLSKNEYCPH